MKVVISSTACRAKKWFFRPPEASNGPMIKPFELGGLQMIPSEPPMSNSSGVTHMIHTIKPKFSFWKKICKKLSYFLKQKIAAIQAKSLCVQKNVKKVEFFNIEQRRYQTLFWK